MRRDRGPKKSTTVGPRCLRLAIEDALGIEIVEAIKAAEAKVSIGLQN
jgi:hypothetical protein